MLKKLIATISGFFKKQKMATTVEQKTVEQKAEGLINDLKDHVYGFQLEAEYALSMFRNTVKKLQFIDDSITAKRGMIKSYVDQLTGLDSDLGQKQDANTKIKTKLEDFLN